MFYGRENELRALTDLYHRPKGNLVVVYGRRRIGKSTLINHFVKDKMALKFEGLEQQPTSTQIKHFSNSLKSKLSENNLLQKANFYIIQKELNFTDMDFLKKYPEINFMGEKIINFSDTSAIVENMDLIISIDTSLIHLAGAIGKKSFLLLPWVSEWRWLIDRDDSPWYESIKIIRQKSTGDWSYVTNKIEDEINKLRY
jgi:AAA+ ATPase superfamily predicted ATPase